MKPGMFLSAWFSASLPAQAVLKCLASGVGLAVEAIELEVLFPDSGLPQWFSCHHNQPLGIRTVFVSIQAAIHPDGFEPGPGQPVAQLLRRVNGVVEFETPRPPLPHKNPLVMDPVGSVFDDVG